MVKIRQCWALFGTRRDHKPLTNPLLGISPEYMSFGQVHHHL